MSSWHMAHGMVPRHGATPDKCAHGKRTAGLRARSYRNPSCAQLPVHQLLEYRQPTQAFKAGRSEVL